MDLTWNYAGRVESHRLEESRVNFSYLFGNGPAAVRHDPHIATQEGGYDAGLLVLSKLVRGRSEQAV